VAFPRGPGDTSAPPACQTKGITGHGCVGGGRGAYGQDDFIPQPRKECLGTATLHQAEILAVGQARKQPSASTAPLLSVIAR